MANTYLMDNTSGEIIVQVGDTITNETMTRLVALIREGMLIAYESKTFCKKRKRKRHIIKSKGG